MASGKFNTMAEGLSKINADISQLLATPDADLEFLTELQTMVVMKMREPFEGSAGAFPTPGGGAPNAGQGQLPPELAGMLGGAMPPTPIMPGPGAPMPGAGAPSMDETRRLMSGPGGMG